MTFCVSHQKQLDRDPRSDAKKVVTDNDVKDDAMKLHVNGSVKVTESTSLGEQEKHFMDEIKLSWEDSRRHFDLFVCVCVFDNTIIVEIFLYDNTFCVRWRQAFMDQ